MNDPPIFKEILTFKPNEKQYNENLASEFLFKDIRTINFPLLRPCPWPFTRYIPTFMTSNIGIRKEWRKDEREA